ncbi:putative GrpE protein like protein, mitochondrial [Hyaloscypha hepaticicola]|uniref:GrpE protein homolog n=1 Tax=Hyaloscypha hepaticicola TaxID=2082293 RepID=A0A2J6Q8X5_9HELO|nr:putative GrpE protein like protein, mitochondrial [Hyaloscypha hepaticicola]
MIPRTLLRQARAASSSIQTIPRSSLARPQFRQSNLSFALASRPATSRWYSTEPDTKTTEGAAETKSEEKIGDAEDPAKKELEAKNKEIIDLKDRYLRSVAEYRNLQERTKREVQSAKDFALQKFAKDLVDSVDNLDRALAMVPEEKLNAKEKNEHLQDLVSLYDGLKMTETILMQTLKKHGLERFDPSVEGEKFNPNEHEATFMTPMAGKDDNTVFHTQQKGFKLNGRVLRAAKVGVVKNN